MEVNCKIIMSSSHQREGLMVKCLTCPSFNLKFVSLSLWVSLGKTLHSVITLSNNPRCINGAGTDKFDLLNEIK